MWYRTHKHRNVIETFVTEWAYTTQEAAASPKGRGNELVNYSERKIRKVRKGVSLG